MRNFVILSKCSFRSFAESLAVAILLSVAIITQPPAASAVPVEGHRIAVTGPSPYSVQIVKDIHDRGGNVVDALVAAALELAVTHPYYAALRGRRVWR